MNDTFYFIISGLSHLSIVITTLIDRNKSKLKYGIGHYLIFIAMFVRIKSSYRYDLLPTIFGSIGHNMLISYFITTTFINDMNPKSIGFYFNILHIIGQIGMVILYLYLYIENHIIRDKYKLKKIIKITEYISFGISSLFFMYNVIKTKDIKHVIANLLMTITSIYALYKSIELKRNIEQDESYLQ
tara:strand:- start:7 stop:564 length:558 start_codon:yes stop_codon:yes gene_type:complete